MTGEQPIVIEKEPAVRLNFDRVMVLFGFFASVAAVWGGYLVTKRDVETLQATTAEQSSTIKNQQTELNSLNVRLAVSENSFNELSRKLERMDEKLDRILDARTTNANYRQPSVPR